MSWADWAQLAVSAYDAYNQGEAADKGADAVQQAGQLSADEQRRQYDLTRNDRMPWLQAGTSALAQMMALNSGDFRSFRESPDYQFALQQGMQGLDRSAAARGGLYSGGHSADVMKFGQGLAAQQYGTYYSRLSDLANGGNATAGALGAHGMGMANSIGNLNMASADARRSSYYDRANAYSNFGQQAMDAYGNYNGRNG